MLRPHQEPGGASACQCAACAGVCCHRPGTPASPRCSSAQRAEDAAIEDCTKLPQSPTTLRCLHLSSNSAFSCSNKIHAGTQSTLAKLARSTRSAATASQVTNNRQGTERCLFINANCLRYARAFSSPRRSLINRMNSWLDRMAPPAREEREGGPGTGCRSARTPGGRPAWTRRPPPRTPRTPRWPPRPPWLGSPAAGGAGCGGAGRPRPAPRTWKQDASTSFCLSDGSRS